MVFAVLFLKADSTAREDGASKNKAPNKTPAPAPSASSFDKSWNTNPLFSDHPPLFNDPDDSVGPDVDEPGPPVDPTKAIQYLADARRVRQL